MSSLVRAVFVSCDAGFPGIYKYTVFSRASHVLVRLASGRKHDLVGVFPIFVKHGARC